MRNKGTGIALLVVAIAFGMLAYKEHDANSADIKIGKLELSAEKKNNSNEMIYWGLAGAALIGSVALIASKK